MADQILETNTKNHTMAITYRSSVKFVRVVICDKRNCVTVIDDDGQTSKWNTRTGREWGKAGRLGLFPPTLVSLAEGKRNQSRAVAQAECEAYGTRINAALKPVGQHIRVDKWDANCTRENMLELAENLVKAADFLVDEASKNIPDCK